MYNLSELFQPADPSTRELQAALLEKESLTDEDKNFLLSIREYVAKHPKTGALVGKFAESVAVSGIYRAMLAKSEHCQKFEVISALALGPSLCGGRISLSNLEFIVKILKEYNGKTYCRWDSHIEALEKKIAVKKAKKYDKS